MNNKEQEIFDLQDQISKLSQKMNLLRMEEFKDRSEDILNCPEGKGLIAQYYEFNKEFKNATLHLQLKLSDIFDFDSFLTYDGELYEYDLERVRSQLEENIDAVISNVDINEKIDQFCSDNKLHQKLVVDALNLHIYPG